MAAGDTLAIFDALASRPPDDDPATLDIRGESPVLDFDDAADESTMFSGVTPSSYTSGPLTIRLVFAATSALSGSVVWQAAFERRQAGVSDLDNSGFGPATASSATVAPVSGALAVATLMLPTAALSGAASGEPFRLLVGRLATDAADNAVGDAELLAVEMREA